MERFGKMVNLLNPINPHSDLNLCINKLIYLIFMTIAEAQQYARWWNQNSYKHKDGIPPYVLQAWQMLNIQPESTLVLSYEATRMQADGSYSEEFFVQQPLIRKRRKAGS
jgi:hypothetical protein